jgi:cupin fold WbuC family metalloprotein
MNQVDRVRIQRAIQAARQSPRLRMNDNLHGMEDAIHRLLNATEPGTYVQPHRHRTPAKVETLMVIAGKGAILTFDDTGAIAACALLSPSGPCHVAEIPAGEWHTLIALEPGTVWFEVKPGPYAAPPPEDQATWAPPPQSPDVAGYLGKLVARANATT